MTTLDDLRRRKAARRTATDPSAEILRDLRIRKAAARLRVRALMAGYSHQRRD